MPGNIEGRVVIWKVRGSARVNVHLTKHKQLLHDISSVYTLKHTHSVYTDLLYLDLRCSL